MSIVDKLSIVALAAALGGLFFPAFAQNGSDGTQSGPDRGMNMGHMGRGMMSHGMMGSGCSEMMQSMNNDRDGRPNSQWQKHPPAGPDSGG